MMEEMTDEQALTQSAHADLCRELKANVNAISARCDGVPESPTFDDLKDALRSIKYKVQYAERAIREYRRGVR